MGNIFNIFKKIFSTSSSILYLCFLKLIFYRKLKFGIRSKFDAVPTLIIRENGKIWIGNISSRKHLTLRASGGTITVGNNCFFNDYCSINSHQAVTIGDNTIFGEAVKIYDHNHLFDEYQGINHHEFESRAVSIGKNCWIGSNVTILRGVKICDNVVVAAGSVVTKSISEPGIWTTTKIELQRLS